MQKFDIFISYNWDVKPAVENLYRTLTQVHGFKVWLDAYEMGQSRLVEELSTAIAHSTLFLCCITKKYSESENCKDEIDYAKNLKKKMIVLMFERIPMEELGGVGFIIGPKVRFNCYKDTSLFQNWSGSIFDTIMEAIREGLNEADYVTVTGKEKDSLRVNESLGEEGILCCTSKQYFAVLQSDGNLVVYKSSNFKRDRPLWASNTWNLRNPRPFNLTLLSNGELVLKDKNGTNVWTSNSANKGSPGDYRLDMQNDGNLVLYDKNKQAIWATNTWNN